METINEALKQQLKHKKDLWDKAKNKLNDTVIESGATAVGGVIGGLAGPGGIAVGSGIGGAIGKGITFVKNTDKDDWSETWKNIKSWWSYNHY
ncbi:hypothetical protein [Italian clover phyllody phytoplasma]|uniref:hypothetical protein n=1 Tax=Italian clover phyllody phytoplasma TaxID=1196420 RepID=UPI0002F5FB21|nr:hypothetical protein [Italian clover phyllody phytoplasma]